MKVGTQVLNYEVSLRDAFGLFGKIMPECGWEMVTTFKKSVQVNGVEKATSEHRIFSNGAGILLGVAKAQTHNVLYFYLVEDVNHIIYTHNLYTAHEDENFLQAALCIETISGVNMMAMQSPLAPCVIAHSIDNIHVDISGFIEKHSIFLTIHADEHKPVHFILVQEGDKCAMNVGSLEPSDDVVLPIMKSYVPNPSNGVTSWMLHRNESGARYQAFAAGDNQ